METPAWLDTAAYPFTHRSVALPRGRMHYVDEGQGEPLLFVHGTPTWSFEYRHLIRGLRAEARCLAPDHLGFGLSERPAGLAYTPEEHAQNLRAFVEALELRDLTLVVHDFGGPIALPLALERPSRVKRLVVLNSWCWPLEGELEKRARQAQGGLVRFLYRRLDASLRLLMPGAYGDRRKLTKAIHRQYRAVFPDADSREQVLYALARSLLGSREHYARLWEGRGALAQLPALVLWGMKDRAFPPALLERWREALPQADVVQLADSGHWPHEEEPERVLGALRRFLAGTAGVPGRGRPAAAPLPGGSATAP